MPILLDEDYNYPLPAMRAVRQIFPKERLNDIEGRVTNELSKPEIAAKIKPGAKAAVAVGSRGIRNIRTIVKTTVNFIRSAGGLPFIVSAMGSHGGGTPEGQMEILRSYGITEESIGADIVTSADVVSLGRTSRGIDVYFDKRAFGSDLVIPINRVKLHTDFTGDIQSGLCKMLSVGLGNHKGCTALHEDDFDTFGGTILEAAQMIIDSANIGFGIAIVENAADETLLIEALASENLIKREKELLEIAKKNMPTLMAPEIDVLVVGEIGKNISGAGYDTNILGKSYILKEFVLDVPNIKRMALLDLTDESHGNAIGMGAFDVITRKLFNKLDLEQIYANAIAIKCPEDAKIPLIADSEEDAIRIALRITRGLDWNRIKLVKIKNTAELETIYVSDAVWDDIKDDKRVCLI